MRFVYFLVFIFLFFGCTDKNLHVKNTNSTFKPLEAKSISLNEYINDYLNLHYKPWNYKSPMYSKIESFWGYDNFIKGKGYVQENLLPYDENWFDEIFAYSNLEEYGKTTKHAITIQNTNLRVLPTQKPLYKISYQNDDGYPFDLLQNSYIPLMSPINVLNYSKDKSWIFVETSFATGWIKAEHIALVSTKQAETIKNLKHIVITKDNSSIYKNNKLVTNVKIGVVLPIIYEGNKYFYLYLLDKNSKKTVAKIDKNSASTLPLEFNEENIQKIANKLEGESYGWGGINEKRDCSALTRDFMSVFGVWLPRNSGAQKNIGDFFDLSKFSNEDKNRLIANYATPYLSLVYLPGHIMLYVGNDNENALVLHNIWGLRTLKDGIEGRKVIGKSIVSDLFLGKDMEDIDKNNTLINRITGFSTIGLSKSKKSAIKLGISYKNYLHVKDNIIYFKDNSTMVFDDKKDKNLDELLTNADVEDMFKFEYTKGEICEPIKNDPGRVRNEEFFKKIYGKTQKEIERNLVEVTWLPNKIGKKLLFNKNNGAALALQKISNELDKLDDEFLPYVENIGGTYNFRKIAGTERLSMHSFGIAMDINVAKSRYWRWDKEEKNQKELNSMHEIPQKIIDIFEKHGFIWGGKWYHYDTMHFEFRPELL